jgi:hypothetical protein
MLTDDKLRSLRLGIVGSIALAKRSSSFLSLAADFGLAAQIRSAIASFSLQSAAQHDETSIQQASGLARAISLRMRRRVMLHLHCQCRQRPGATIALVIGNGNYQQSLPKLPNPPNDAEDIAKALRYFGFEVIEKKNQTLEAMNQAIAEFGSKIGGSEAALFYYAGHGIQVKGQNYLIPVNAMLDSEASVPYQSVNLNQVLDEMDNGKSGANIVVIDACRNNPISGKFRSGQSRGLASPGSTPKGTVIVYATDPGNVAADGDGRNGLLTAGLLTAFQGKDLSLDGVLTVASAEVEKASHQTQTPYVNGPKTLQKNFNFRVTVDPGRGEIEKTFWNSIEHSSDPSDFEAYLQKYPNGSYASLAENRLRRLKTEQQQVRSPPSTAPSAAFDGRWAVSLTCDDVQVKGKMTKGYMKTFFMDVVEGRLNGQDGEVGVPGNLTLTGNIQADGTVEITASGLTGYPERTVGHAKSGTPYSYLMRGTFTQVHGQATRIGVRPCVAEFSKT